MHDMAVAFDNQKVAYLNGSGPGHTAGIISSQVDKHQVFCPFLWIGKQLFFEGEILLDGRDVPETSALDYVERPFEWSYPHRFGVVRDFEIDVHLGSLAWREVPGQGTEHGWTDGGVGLRWTSQHGEGAKPTAALLAMVLENMGYKALSLLGHQAKVVTDCDFGNARIIEIDTDRIKRLLEQGNIVVVAGFQGMDIKGNITTLGRGGSDTSAVAIAAALKADVCEIYTDVDGVYTVDKDCPPHAKVFYHKTVVHHLVADVHGRTEYVERPLDDLDVAPGDRVEGARVDRRR